MTVYPLGPRERTRILSHLAPGTISTTWSSGAERSPPAPDMYDTNSRHGGFERCSDYVHSKPYTDKSPLTIQRATVKPARFSGTRYDIPFWTDYNNVRFCFRNVDEVYSEPFTLDWGYWETAALARLNPSKPEVDLPLFLLELRELPKLVKQIGDAVLLKRVSASEAYIAKEFGIDPLIGDVKKLLQLMLSLEKRLDHLRRIKRGSKFAGTLYDKEWQYPVWLGDLGFTSYSRYEVRRTKRVWFTCESNPQIEIPIGESPWEQLKYALGLSARPVTIWNAIPWSWMIDWFVNVSEWIELVQNSYPIPFQNMCLMQTNTWDVELMKCGIDSSIPWGIQNLRVSGGTSSLTDKRRVVISSPSAKLSLAPLFSKGSLSILGALSVIHLTPRKRRGISL
jgi:hypothetical protein